MSKNLKVLLEGKDGIFNVEKRVTFHYEHSTTDSVKDQISAIKKEMNKMLKAGEVMISTSWYGSDYNSHSLNRYIISNWSKNDMFVLDYRKFNGYDFSNREEINFGSMTTLVNYVVKHINDSVYDTLAEIPVEDTWYGMKLKAEREM